MNKKLESLIKNQKFDQKHIFNINSSRSLSEKENSTFRKLVEEKLVKNVRITHNVKLNRYLIKFWVAFVDTEKVKAKLSFIDFSRLKLKD